jgi:hypothetical protein
MKKLKMCYLIYKYNVFKIDGGFTYKYNIGGFPITGKIELLNTPITIEQVVLNIDSMVKSF